jgi:glutamate/tyrosine decarboxylase-like PLP-dependent enzyme
MNGHLMSIEISAADRAKLLHALVEEIENYLDTAADATDDSPVAKADIDELLAAFDFDRPIPPAEAMQLAIRGLRDMQPRTRHRRYFGLFDATPTTMSIIGEALTATFNACLATRNGSPFGIAAEEKLIAAFGEKFGYPPGEVDGILTSGGSETNLSAMLLALTHQIPGYPQTGLIGLASRPVVYVSPEAHPSVPRAVRLTGLGAESVREVETDCTQRMDLLVLEKMIAADKRAGLTPLAVVLTAGTTGAGVIDPIEGAACIAARHGLWLHVDAAWGGAAALLPDPDPAFHGLARADSITFDPHKWMSVPLGLGLLLTRHRGLLARTFSVSPSFLDTDGRESEPFSRSLRWSRSFAALRLLLSLGVSGWQGFGETLRHQMRLADELRKGLAGSGWEIVNDTPLPLVCFLPGDRAGQHPHRLRLIARTINSTGDAHIFVVKSGGRLVLRASITNQATTEADIVALIGMLDDAAQGSQGLSGFARLRGQGPPHQRPAWEVSPRWSVRIPRALR